MLPESARQKRKIKSDVEKGTKNPKAHFRLRLFRFGPILHDPKKEGKFPKKVDDLVKHQKTKTEPN